MGRLPGTRRHWDLALVDDRAGTRERPHRGEGDGPGQTGSRHRGGHDTALPTQHRGRHGTSTTPDRLLADKDVHHAPMRHTPQRRRLEICAVEPQDRASRSRPRDHDRPQGPGDPDAVPAPTPGYSLLLPSRDEGSALRGPARGTQNADQSRESAGGEQEAVPRACAERRPHTEQLRPRCRPRRETHQCRDRRATRQGPPERHTQ